MNREDVHFVVEALVAKFEWDFDAPIERRGPDYPEGERRPPEPDDWAALEAKFGCTFEDSFVHFMEIIPTTIARERSPCAATSRRIPSPTHRPGLGP